MNTGWINWRKGWCIKRSHTAKHDRTHTYKKVYPFLQRFDVAVLRYSAENTLCYSAEN